MTESVSDSYLKDVMEWRVQPGLKKAKGLTARLPETHKSMYI